jgi:hypothetical protein
LLKLLGIENQNTTGLYDFSNIDKVSGKEEEAKQGKMIVD